VGVDCVFVISVYVGVVCVFVILVQVDYIWVWVCGRLYMGVCMSHIYRSIKHKLHTLIHTIQFNSFISTFIIHNFNEIKDM